MPNINFIQTNSTNYAYSICGEGLPSRNKLFLYLRQQYQKLKKPLQKPSIEAPTDPPIVYTIIGDVLLIIKSTITPNPTKPLGYRFYGWKYTTIRVSQGYLDSDNKLDIYLDTSYLVSLIDYTYLKRVLPNIEIRKISLLILVRGVGNKVVKTNKYIIVKMYIRGSITENPIIVAIIIKIYLINNLKANLLVGNNSLKP